MKIDMDDAMEDKTQAQSRLRVGVDVGGTFTDIVVFLPDGKIAAKKVLSSPPQFNVAIRSGSAVFGRSSQTI